MPNYLNGKIYKIHSYQTDDIYIGSTTNTLSRRFSGHKTKFRCGHYKGHSANELLKNDDIMITLIENCPCNDNNELLKKERYYIENINCVNKKKPTRTQKEYYEDHKDKKHQYQKIYDCHRRSHFGIICKSYGIFD